MIVAGDTTPDAIIPVLEEALKGWTPGETGTPTMEMPTKPEGVSIYLVDKPDAAQSIIAAGHVGLARSTPDYFPVQIMNAILGGSFTSRINMNLREKKGYTYGARSSFSFRQGPGPFEAGAPVRTNVTKEAVVELIRELEEITGPKGATQEEVQAQKDRVIKSFPARFESIGGGGPRGGGGGLTSALAELVLYGLPDDYFANYRAKVEAVTKADVDRVAQAYLDPKRIAILIVGDRAKVEPALKSLPYAKVISVLTPQGDPAPSKEAIDRDAR